MIERNRGNLGPAEPLGGQQPAMPGNHFAVSFDEDRNVEAERLDALGDLADLFGAVLASVARVGLQLIDRLVGDRQLAATPGAKVSVVLCHKVSSTFAARGRSARIGRYVEPRRFGRGRSRSETAEKNDPSQVILPGRGSTGPP